MPQFSPVPPSSWPDEGPHAKPWSMAAVSAMAFSLLGCLGFPALLGLILGVIGIFRAKGGRRRGMGLAIAAIPISLLTGAAFSLLTVAFLVSSWISALMAATPALFRPESGQGRDAVEAIRPFAGESFMDEVNVDRLETWLRDVDKRHGSFIQIVEFEAGGNGIMSQKAKNGIRLKVRAKWVNGLADIIFHVKRRGMFGLMVDDIVVDGMSPRDRSDRPQTP